MEKFIAVIDYGLGNLRSVAKALEAVGARVKVTNQSRDLSSCAGIVLPGVGAFKRAMDNLARLKIIPALLKEIQAGKLFLGICLGLQVLFTESQEHGSHQGLGVIKGKVKKFPAQVKIPHMGWNQISFRLASARAEPWMLFREIPGKSYFYFVHSYYVEPEDEDIAVTTTEYGQEFASAINRDNLWGVQFHPEKSERLGLKVLENFWRNVG